jgi:hypothetical protein
LKWESSHQIRKQIQHIKTLKDKGAWMSKNNGGDKGTIYQSNPVSILKGMGSQSTKKLFQHSIQTVTDILAMTEEDISSMVSNQTNPISCGLLQQFHDEAATCQHEE